MWEKLHNGVNKGIDIIGCTMVAATILCTTVNIFLRWTIGRSIGELDEISQIALVWMTYVGMGLLYEKSEHICMDFIVKKLPYIPRIIVVFIDSLVELAAGCIISYLAVKLMTRSFIRTLNVTHLPYAYVQLSIAIGFALLAVAVLIRCGHMISNIVHHRNAFEEEKT